MWERTVSNSVPSKDTTSMIHLRVLPLLIPISRTRPVAFGGAEGARGLPGPCGVRLPDLRGVLGPRGAGARGQGRGPAGPPGPCRDQTPGEALERRVCWHFFMVAVGTPSAYFAYCGLVVEIHT